MPTYDYRCKKCGHEMDAFQSITEPALVTCPKCGADELRRLIGAGAGILFRGSGFYETDYKRVRKKEGGENGGGKSSGSDAKPAETKRGPDKREPKPRESKPKPE